MQSGVTPLLEGYLNARGWAAAGRCMHRLIVRAHSRWQCPASGRAASHGITMQAAPTRWQRGRHSSHVSRPPAQCHPVFFLGASLFAPQLVDYGIVTVKSEAYCCPGTALACASWRKLLKACLKSTASSRRTQGQVCKLVLGQSVRDHFSSENHDRLTCSMPYAKVSADHPPRATISLAGKSCGKSGIYHGRLLH